MSRQAPRPGSPDDSADDAADGPISAAPALPQPLPLPGESRDEIIEAIVRFIGSPRDDEGPKFIRRAAIRRLYGRKRADAAPGEKKSKKQKDDEEYLLDEIVSLTVVRALEAEWPPWTRWGIPGWVTRLTHRSIYAHFHDREDDVEHLARGVDVAQLGGSQAFPKTDYGARAHFLAKQLDLLFKGDPAREKTFRLMWAKDVDGWTLEELAAENHTTVGALSNRFHKLRKELAPKVTAWDDEKKRRSILFMLFGAVLVWIAVLIVWLWQPLQQPPHRPVQPVRIVVPAPAPSFDQALPPTSVADAGNDDDKKAPDESKTPR